MNDRLERELTKMTPEGRKMWEEIVEEEEQVMMELLESWEMAGLKKYAGEKKMSRWNRPLKDGETMYVWSQRFGDWINLKTGEGLVGEHCITGEKHTEARELLQFMEEELKQQTPEQRRKVEQMLAENEDEMFEMLDYWREVKTKNEAKE